VDPNTLTHDTGDAKGEQRRTHPQAVRVAAQLEVVAKARHLDNELLRTAELRVSLASVRLCDLNLQHDESQTVDSKRNRPVTAMHSRQRTSFSSGRLFSSVSMPSTPPTAASSIAMTARIVTRKPTFMNLEMAMPILRARPESRKLITSCFFFSPSPSAGFAFAFTSVENTCTMSGNSCTSAKHPRVR
jgi:hypothetical protein